MSTAALGSKPVPETNILVVGGPTVGAIVIAGPVGVVCSALATGLQSRHAVSNSKNSVSVKGRCVALFVPAGMNVNVGDGSAEERFRCMVRLVNAKFSGPKLIVWLFESWASSPQGACISMRELLLASLASRQIYSANY